MRSFRKGVSRTRVLSPFKCPVRFPYRVLTSPAEEAHALARHVCDYVLVWGQRSDLGKSTHMVKIANSVFAGHCAEEDCDAYGRAPRDDDSRFSLSFFLSLLRGHTHRRVPDRASEHVDERVFAVEARGEYAAALLHRGLPQSARDLRKGIGLGFQCQIPKKIRKDLTSIRARSTKRVIPSRALFDSKTLGSKSVTLCGRDLGGNLR